MRLHNNGRMMDIYWRLHEPEAKFFMPYDLELSNEELGYICRKAEKWRGQEGEQRKVGVYHYTWEEEDVSLLFVVRKPFNCVVRKPFNEFVQQHRFITARSLSRN